MHSVLQKLHRAAALTPNPGKVPKSSLKEPVHSRT
jgi:hypothetical protein